MGAAKKEVLSASLVGKGKQFQKLGVVVEHFLKMRDQPFLVDGVSRETSSQVVVDAALADVLQRELHELQESRLAPAQTGAPKQFQHRALWVFRRLTQSSVGLIESAGDRGGDGIEFCRT